MPRQGDTRRSGNRRSAGGHSGHLLTAFGAVRESLASSLWFVPSIFMGASIAAALLLAWLDRYLGDAQLLFVFSGGPEGARAVLETIASSILTLAALVFSITILVLQLTSSQYSPRALRTFLRDVTSKVTIGVFLGTFVFALMGLREVRSEGGQEEFFVPSLMITGAFIMTLVTLYMFLFYIHHISRRIQASSIIASIADETIESMDRRYPRHVNGDVPLEAAVHDFGKPVQTLFASAGGMVVSVDEIALSRLAERSGHQFGVLVGPGEFVVTGQPLIEVFLTPVQEQKTVIRKIRLGEQRTMEQDVEYGFRQLVDVANKALSPGINDPSTAVQALDRIHDLLFRLGGRVLEDPVCTDIQGEPRVTLKVPKWEMFVRLGVEDILHYGGNSPDIRKRLGAMYRGLVQGLPEKRADVVRQVALELGWARE